MEPRSARIDGSGRLVIPAAVRRELELRDGDEVVFTAGDAPRQVRIMSRQAALTYAQSLVRKHARRTGSAVEELLAERREDAAREQAAGEARSRRRGTRSASRRF
jgi:AbrB family looped-hinge helix DNA binding protein